MSRSEEEAHRQNPEKEQLRLLQKPGQREENIVAMVVQMQVIME